MTDWVVGGHEGQFSRDRLPVYPAGGPCEQFRYGQRCPLFDVVHPAFPLPTTASPTLHGALKDGFGEAVVACDMPGPCKFPSLGSCQKMWTLAPHLVVGLVLQVGGAQTFPHTVGFESRDRFFQSQEAGTMFHSLEEDGGGKRLVKLEPACKADGIAPPDPD